MDLNNLLEKTDSMKIVYSILIFTILVFALIFSSSNFLTYDDNWYIYENQNVIHLSWKSIKNILTSVQGGQYSPLSEIYHSILFAIFGKNATAFKVMALIVHLLNVSILFHILDNLFKKKSLVIFSALIFAIHPMQVETIGWISVIYRNAVLFMFLGYFFYIKYLDSEFKLKYLFPTLLCFVLAMLNKEQAILFPIGLFILSLAKLEKPVTKRFFIEMSAWFIISLIFGLITIQITKTGGPSLVDTGDSIFNKFALLSKTILDYSLHFILPSKLSFSYPYPNQNISNGVLSILIALIFITISSYVSLKNKIFRIGFLWTIGFLSLSLLFAFFHLRDSYMADRYIYVAIIGYAIMLHQFLDFLLSKFNKDTLLIPIAIVLIFTLGIISFNRVNVFKNSKSLWSQAIKVNPNNKFAYNSLGYYYRNQSQLDTALVLYKKALKIDSNYRLAHSNIGKVYYSKKQYDSALFHISKAIKINPTYQRSYENRAAIYSKTNQTTLLLKDLNKIITFKPQSVKYRIERAKIFFKQKKYKKALVDLEIALKFDPNDHYTNYLAGHSNLLIKKNKNAINYLNRAIKLNTQKPDYFFIRANAFIKEKKYNAALKDFKKAKKMGYKVKDIQILATKLLADKAKKASLISK